MRLCSIASGSSGNCIYVGSESSHVLIDAGISGKRIEAGVNSLGITMKDVSGIFVTHEHADHIQGLGVVARRYGIPLYMTEKTKEAVQGTASIGKIDPNLFHVVSAGGISRVGDLEIIPMSVSHDAADPVAYRVFHGKKSAGVCTDLGEYTQDTVDFFRKADALLVESNHDVHMLQVGPYPYPLKQRILGQKGHLSNEACGKLLTELLHPDLKGIFLGHLSHENNMPEIAFETVRLEITMSESPYNGNDFPISVASRQERSGIIEF